MSQPDWTSVAAVCISLGSVGVALRANHYSRRSLALAQKVHETEGHHVRVRQMDFSLKESWDDEEPEIAHTFEHLCKLHVQNTGRGEASIVEIWAEPVRPSIEGSPHATQVQLDEIVDGPGLPTRIKGIETLYWTVNLARIHRVFGIDGDDFDSTRSLVSFYVWLGDGTPTDRDDQDYKLSLANYLKLWLSRTGRRIRNPGYGRHL